MSSRKKEVYMSKTMTKYQLEHFKDKVKRNFEPLIKEQELLVKQYKTEATNRVVNKLAKKMGAEKILSNFRKAEALLRQAQADARTFFKKKADKDKKEINDYRYNRSDNTMLSVSACEEQMRDWAQELVEAEIRRRPEGAKLKQLEQLKQHSIDTVMESGTPEELIKQLDNATKKIGIAWVVNTSKIKQISSE